MNLNDLKNLIEEEINRTLKEDVPNNGFAVDFASNSILVKKLVKQFENIADLSAGPERIKELKIDLSKMFIRSLDAQSQAKYKNFNDVSLVNLSNEIINFYKRTIQKRK